MSACYTLYMSNPTDTAVTVTNLRIESAETILGIELAETVAGLISETLTALRIELAATEAEAADRPSAPADMEVDRLKALIATLER